MNVLSKILRMAGSLLMLVLMSAGGGLLGAYLGGNWWVDLKLFGVRGYEALGLVGMMLGLASGGLISWRLWFR